MAKGIMGNASLPLFDWSSQCFSANEGETNSAGIHKFYFNSPETPQRVWTSHANLFEATLNTNILINTTAPNLNPAFARLTTVLALLLLPERNSINLYLLLIRFIRLLNMWPGKFPILFSAFLDIKFSTKGNRLFTSVHYKPTDSHRYLLYSSSHPSQVKNSIPYSQFLRLVCSEDSDFSFTYIILIAPGWHIRLRPEISIAPCPLLLFEVLSMSSLIFPLNQRKCAICSTNTAILPLLLKRAIIAPNKLIGSHDQH